jgi:hypothetical protein
MQAEAILLRIDRDRLDVEFVGRAHDADGDLAAIGDQQPPNPLEHQLILVGQIGGQIVLEAAAARRLDGRECLP